MKSSMYPNETFIFRVSQANISHLYWFSSAIVVALPVLGYIQWKGGRQWWVVWPVISEWDTFLSFWWSFVSTMYCYSHFGIPIHLSAHIAQRPPSPCPSLLHQTITYPPGSEATPWRDYFNNFITGFNSDDCGVVIDSTLYIMITTNHSGQGAHKKTPNPQSP